MTLFASETHKDVTLMFRAKQTLFHGNSPYQAVDVVETTTYGRMLLLDGCVMTTEKDEFIYHEMISHVPLLVHPSPKRVLIIGGGDGGTIREVVKHPEVETVVLCEIDGMVVDACKQYLPSIAAAFNHPAVQVNIGDGVAYMAEKARDFDIIIIDSSDPIGPGEGLFTETFYRNAFKALKPDGIMVAQTESPFLDAELIRKIYPMYHRIFPVVRMYTGQVPTYPGGYWTWAYCAKQYEPDLPQAHQDRVRRIEATCKYYNAALHQAAFVLPNFVKDLIQTPVSVN